MSFSLGGDKNGPPDRKFFSLKLSAPKKQPIKKKCTSVTSKRGKCQTTINPAPPNLKHIIDNHAQLNLSITGLNNTNNPAEFNFTVDDGIMITDNKNFNTISVDPVTDDISLPIYKSKNKDFIYNITDNNLFSFSESYSCSIYIIINSTDTKLHPGKIHLIKISKLIHGLIKGMTKIKPIGASVRLTFDNISNANLCLTSQPISNHDFMTSISTTLVNSVIRLDQNISQNFF